VNKNIFLSFSFLALSVQSTLPVLAGWGKFTIDSGSGDQVEVKHGLFGRKTVVKDRLGDGFASSHSILGTKSTEASVLGNGVRYHKGLLGFSSASAHTMLGDSITTHKGLFTRNTNVNVSGINSLLGRYIHPPAPVGQGAPMPDPADAAEPIRRLSPPGLNGDGPPDAAGAGQGSSSY